MGVDISFMFIALKEAIKYIPITLILAIIPFIIGIVVGTLIAVIRIYKVKVLSRLMQILVVIIRGIPLVVILYIVFFEITLGFDAIADKFNWIIHSKDINVIYIAMIAITISAIANISETIRGGIISVGKTQFEAAYSVGLTRNQTLRRIIIPQAFPVILPSLCNNFIGLIKGSSIAYLITVVDIMNGALITATANYRFLEAYIAAAIVYWILCVLIEKISFIFEKRLSIHVKKENCLFNVVNTEYHS
ncbi:amino acid ABC transporter permease [uncultured Clostridium sp.]|uniref:amino acid ABC transporter permease n=1 Tax=uncultured Clostridium sp. TaxID=59620 RepID=UPI0028F10D60|nr:amino acid ABC transporter permease [uncultured Clostridium sp.]